MERRKMYLIIIIVILVVLIGIAAYYLYQSDRMQKVDKLMLDNNNNLTPKLNAKVAEANIVANSSSTDYDKLGNLIDESIIIQNQIISNDEKANQYADGPYKELMALALTKDRLGLNELNSWRNRIEYIKQGDFAQASQLLAQENNLMTEITKAVNDYKNFKSTHLDVKEHCIKYWNSTRE